ncbi:peptidase [Pseudomonas sp. C27(2019)]|uniref:PepSY domain-containing protein n=1 Tax=Pseudomonas sp. C27(2019) TaxID=2604941 RepID=UPI001247BCC7|nr:PepSY domain-containing protein [Pseudomonas sp. C27(2019)]QEY58203.1 peptidase [Pseudomonas sp. C27(2019)]
MRKGLLYTGLAIFFVAASGQISARDLSQDEALRLRQEGTILSSQTLIERALERHPKAHLLELELEEEHGRYIYEIELLTVQGQVRELKFDASNGDLLEDEEDD